MKIPRRKALHWLTAFPGLASLAPLPSWSTPSQHPSKTNPFRLATFSSDVTVPLGHGMMGGSWKSKSVADPLEARGWVLLGPQQPIVFCSVDWCEIRNDAYARWQEALAAAAGTSPERVLLTSIHQHDTPVMDLTAEKLLRERGLQGSVCDPGFHEIAVRRTAGAVRDCLPLAQPCSHVGTGQATVHQLASNRRYTMPDGSIRFDRTSSTRNAFAIAADEGLIDAQLKVLSFWNQDRPLAATSFYAVHPMSYYGQGEISADFPGLARRQRQKDTPGIHQIYASGCSGNVTAGKYNSGDRALRAVLAQRLLHGMVNAWDNTRRQPLRQIEFRSHPFTLPVRQSSGFSESELLNELTPNTRPFKQCLAAMGLSWRKRVQSGVPLQLPCLDLGSALLTILPGETYVEYQLSAQRLRPDRFVCVAGYGDGATGYVPTEKHWAEHDTNLGDWCWVDPGSEFHLTRALENALRPARSPAIKAR